MRSFERPESARSLGFEPVKYSKFGYKSLEKQSMALNNTTDGGLRTLGIFRSKRVSTYGKLYEFGYF